MRRSVSTRARRRPVAAGAILLFFACCLVLGPREAGALYFYLGGTQHRCFLQELAKDTAVVGEYVREEWDEAKKAFFVNENVEVRTTVEELPEKHVVLDHWGGSKGKFSFTAADSSDHAVCLDASKGASPGNKARLHLTMHVGEEAAESPETDEKLSGIARMVKDLNKRITDLTREQGYQRELEELFRNRSEQTNSRVVYWTIFQLLILAAVCTWQMKHLKGFFEAKKLV